MPSQKKGKRIAIAVADETHAAIIHARVPSTVFCSSGVTGLSVMLRLSLLQLVRQINYLAHVVICVARRAQENVETLFCLRLALRRVFLEPVFRPLFSNRFDDHSDRAVERCKYLFSGDRLRLRKLPVAIAHVTRSG